MARRKESPQTDWRSITDDKEKYAAYLCSREWNVLKEAVHKRAGGKCERCKVLPIAAVHHLTYERKFREELEDLAGWCQACHEFTHAKSGFDPEFWLNRHLLRFLDDCRRAELRPPPIEWMSGLRELEDECDEIVTAADVLHTAKLHCASITLSRCLPFYLPNRTIRNQLEYMDPMSISKCYLVMGFDSLDDSNLIDDSDSE